MSHRETSACKRGYVRRLAGFYDEGNNDIKKSLYVYMIHSGNHISSPNLFWISSSSASSACVA